MLPGSSLEVLLRLISEDQQSPVKGLLFCSVLVLTDIFRAMGHE